MKLKTTFALAAVAASLLLGHAAQADTVLLMDDFNAENGGSGALNYTTFANWNSTGAGFMDLIGNGFFDFYPGNGLYLDTDGSPGPGEITSKMLFSLTPGNTYKLTFDLGGSQRGDVNTVNVSLGSAFSESFTLNSGDPLATISRNFTVPAAMSGNLVFSHADAADNLGLILDNVKLSEVNRTDVPEPGTVAMLGGLLVSGLVVLRRRRK